MHSSSEIHAILDVGPTSIHSLPATSTHRARQSDPHTATGMPNSGETRFLLGGAAGFGEGNRHGSQYPKARVGG